MSFFQTGGVPLDRVCVEGGELRRHACPQTRSLRMVPFDFGGKHPYLLHEVAPTLPLTLPLTLPQPLTLTLPVTRHAKERVGIPR